MDIAVMLEQVPNNGFRATSFGPSLISEGPTREAALERMRQSLADQLAHAEVVHLQVPGSAEHPWQPLVGRLANHPDADEIEQNLRAYRQQVDADAERL